MDGIIPNGLQGERLGRQLLLYFFRNHLRQRGNNKEACFYEIDDYHHYLDLLSTMCNCTHMY